MEDAHPRDDVSDVDSEAYLGDEQGNLGQQDQEVADLQGAEAGAVHAPIRASVTVVVQAYAEVVVSKCARFADGGYDSESEEGDEPADQTAEVKDDALQTLTAHTGGPLKLTYQ